MKALLFVFGWISFGLGVIGAFLPVIPTTPFLILSAYLFSKSSPRFHAWLLSLPFAGPAINDWNQNRVVRPRAKVLCSVMILLSLGSIWYFSSLRLFAKGLVTIILLGVMLFVVTQKSSTATGGGES